MTAPSTSAAPVSVSVVVAALERTWGAIRARHPEVPECAIIVASGMKGGEMDRLGHYWHGRWEVTGSGRTPEVMIAGEGLNRGAADVLHTLIHEAVHGLAAARRIADTSRQGRWHNARFATLAAEMGLVAHPCKKIGHFTSLAEGTDESYAGVLGELGSVLTLYRVPETKAPKPPKPPKPDPEEDKDGGEADGGEDGGEDGEGDNIALMRAELEFHRRYAPLFRAAISRARDFRDVAARGPLASRPRRTPAWFDALAALDTVFAELPEDAFDAPSEDGDDDGEDDE